MPNLRRPPAPLRVALQDALPPGLPGFLQREDDLTQGGILFRGCNDVWVLGFELRVADLEFPNGRFSGGSAVAERFSFN